MDSSRTIILALLVVAIAVALFYMMDPTMGGLMGRREGFASVAMKAGEKKEYFTNMEKKEKFQNVIPADGAAASSSGKLPSQYTEGELIAKAIENAKAIKDASAALQAQQGTRNPTVVAAPTAATGATATATEGFANYNPSDMPFPDAGQPSNCYPKNQLAPQELLPNDPNSVWAAANPMGQGDISGKNFLSAGALIGVNTVGQSLRNANQQLRAEPSNPQTQVSIWNQSTIEPDLSRRPLDGF